MPDVDLTPDPFRIPAGDGTHITTVDQLPPDLQPDAAAALDAAAADHAAAIAARPPQDRHLPLPD